MIITIKGGPFDGIVDTAEKGFNRARYLMFLACSGTDRIGKSFVSASEAAVNWMRKHGGTVETGLKENPGFKINHKYTQTSYDVIDGIPHATFEYELVREA